MYKSIVNATGLSHLDNHINWGYGSTVLDLKRTYEYSDCWCSNSASNQYIDIDFKIHYVKITGFSIKTHRDSDYYISEFVFQGSNDASNYNEIYKHSGSNLKSAQANIFQVQSDAKYNHY